jgi:hypothetical protein
MILLNAEKNSARNRAYEQILYPFAHLNIAFSKAIFRNNLLAFLSVFQTIILFCGYLIVNSQDSIVKSMETIKHG